jgi:hypothetical protein
MKLEITKKELEFDEEIKRKADIVCKFCHTKAKYVNGSESIFLNSLTNRYELRDLEMKRERIKEAYFNNLISLEEFKEESKNNDDQQNLISKKIKEEEINSSVDISLESLVLCRNIKNMI